MTLGEIGAVRTRICHEAVSFVERLADVEGLLRAHAQTAPCLDLQLR